MIRKLLVAALACVAGTATAQQYPTKGITLLVPFAPGPTDTVARIMAQAMSKPIGGSFIVENRPSNGGILAPELLTKANPDGYTILIHHIGMATTPALYRQLRFKPMEDFEYIGLINEVPMTLIGRGNLPPNNFKELLDYIKANKAKISMANAGIGAASHLCGMLFQSAIQTDLLTVPYKGTGPAMNDLLGGHVSMMLDVVMTSQPHIKSGKIRGIAVTGLNRSAVLPELPTVAESGYPGFEAMVWLGYFGPAGLPKELAARLNADAVSVLNSPKMKAVLNEQGWDVVANSQSQFTTRIRDEIVKWRKVVQDSGAKAD